jgi:ABC-type dipeptide/oligopeptide/nickel transport system permease subunit
MAIVGGAIISVFVVGALAAPLLAPYRYDAQIFDRLLPPSLQNPLGTDDLGRDQLSRLVYGARISLYVGLISQAIIVAVGLPLGLISGYYGGKADAVIMRLTEVVLTLPTILLAIVVLAVMGRTISNIFIAIGLTSWPYMARLVRGAVIGVRGSEYIEVARVIGAPDRRILTSHVLPNILGPIIVATTFGVPAAMMTEAFLSFIGIGAEPPLPSWGIMINDGFRWIRSIPHLTLFPSLAITLVLLAFNVLGDGMRDALDPRSRT